MKKLFLAAVLFVTLIGCTEHIDTSDRYVFTQKTIAEYLEGKEYYSDYIRLLGEMPVSAVSETTLKQLLSARGHYTVFAPTNAAIQDYLDTLFHKGLITEPSWNGFTNESDLDSIKKVIVYNSILDSGDQEAFTVTAFPESEHEFGITNMYNRKLRVFIGEYDRDSISINGQAMLSKTNRDIVLSNGYVHQVEGVIAPSNDRLGDFMYQWARTSGSGYSVMSKLVLACGLLDTLNAFRDEKWEMLYLTGVVKDLPNHTSVGQVGTIPPHRYYGFTLFAETDHFWEETLGKGVDEITVEDVCNFLRESGLFDHIPGTTYDEDYTSERNVLNQFVTYHLLPQRIGRDKLVIHYNELGFNYNNNKGPTIPIMDYYQTMGLPRLLKTYESRESDGIYLNRFPKLRNGRGQFGPTKENINDYHESGQFPTLKGKSAWPDENQGVRVLTYAEAGTDDTNIANGIIYPIDNLLVCTENVCNQMGTQRIRVESASLMPELMNNDVRAQRAYYNFGAVNVRAIPTNYPYLESVQIREGTLFYYLQGYMSNYHNLQGDEFNIIGRYDFTLKLPPVPRAGQYEVRFGVATGSRVRSMAQVYFGSDVEHMPAAGIPMDLRLGGLERRDGDVTTPSNVGWEADTKDDEYNDRVEKSMRTKGFMKAPNSWSNQLGSSTSIRTFHYMTRRIMVNAYLYPFQNYYIRFQSVLDKEAREFYMDYFEYVSKEVYDNPEEAEDIW
jgi:uncharacterized surface protein with fasciclin (FAS1) repeats